MRRLLLFKLKPKIRSLEPIIGGYFTYTFIIQGKILTSFPLDDKVAKLVCYFYNMGLQQLDLFGAFEDHHPDVKSKVVFADEKIKVSVKVKKEEPLPEKEVVIPVNTGKKRGRKSTKEIYASVDLIHVPEDDILNKKLYYSISEVAGWFNATTSQIRFWENEFDILQPRKNRKGDRLFRVEDVKNLQLIYYLLRNRKFSIEGAKNYLKADKNKAQLNHQLAESLIKFRAFLLELKANLES